MVRSNAYAPTALAKGRSVALRTWLDADVDWYAELVASPEVMRFIGDGRPRGRDRATAEIRRFREETERLGWSRWVVEKTSTREPVGYVGFSVQGGRIDWGGRSFSRFWGSRSVIEAAQLALRLGLIDYGLPYGEATTVLENHRAWRLNAFFGFQEVGTYEENGVPMVRQRIEPSMLRSDGRRTRSRTRCERRVA